MSIWHVVNGSCLPIRGNLGGTPSVLELARRQADDHRWFESQRCGRDAGPSACCDWFAQNWKRFCRWRYVEHLLGIRRYREFDPRTFSILRDHVDWRHDPVMEYVLLQTLQADCEQLDLLYIAPDEVNRGRLVAILDLLNLNAARLGRPDST